MANPYSNSSIFSSSENPVAKTSSTPDRIVLGKPTPLMMTVNALLDSETLFLANEQKMSRRPK